MVSFILMIFSEILWQENLWQTFLQKHLKMLRYFLSVLSSLVDIQTRDLRTAAAMLVSQNVILTLSNGSIISEKDTLTYHQCRTIVHTVLNFTHPDIFDSSDNDSIINAFSR